ncbi:MAG: hypothetical protein IJB73_05530 [Firmicutes bacterium]|nr:hypothetical protein [Bacillota bacterium]
MNRKSRTILNIGIILLTAVYILALLLPQAGLFYSLEEMLELEMRGRRYGEHEEILKTYTTEDGAGIILGRYEDGLALGYGWKKGFLWERNNIVCLHSDNVFSEGMAVFVPGTDSVCGYFHDDETAEVMYIFERVSTGEKGEFLQDTVEVEDGFFFKNYYKSFRDERTDLVQCTYIEGRNATGEVIWTGGSVDNVEGVYETLNMQP